MLKLNEELQALLSRPTADVPDVGRICYGLSRNGSYDAVRRGEIETIRVGRLLKVPTAPLRKKLGID
ncbi:DNA-binding protein [Bradyrhizobium sp. USDA 4504]